MIRGICLSAAALVMLASPAFAAAGDMCMAPSVPTMPNGRTAPASEIIAAANAVKAYVADSDVYQQCLRDEIERMEKQAADEKKPVDNRLRATLVKRGDDNQTSKEKLGAAYNATAAAYRQAHPPAR